MAVRLMTDVHVRRQIVVRLRLRGVDVRTAQDDGSSRLPDDQLLDRARELGRALFSQDSDMLAEATRRQRSAVPFAGLIFAPQPAITVGQAIADLELIAKVYEPTDIADRVEFLPLK